MVVILPVVVIMLAMNVMFFCFVVALFALTWFCILWIDCIRFIGTDYFQVFTSAVCAFLFYLSLRLYPFHYPAIGSLALRVFC